MLCVVVRPERTFSFVHPMEPLDTWRVMLDAMAPPRPPCDRAPFLRVASKMRGAMVGAAQDALDPVFALPASELCWDATARRTLRNALGTVCERIYDRAAKEYVDIMRWHARIPVDSEMLATMFKETTAAELTTYAVTRLCAHLLVALVKRAFDRRGDDPAKLRKLAYDVIAAMFSFAPRNIVVFWSDPRTATPEAFQVAACAAERVLAVRLSMAATNARAEVRAQLMRAADGDLAIAEHDNFLDIAEVGRSMPTMEHWPATYVSFCKPVHPTLRPADGQVLGIHNPWHLFRRTDADGGRSDVDEGSA